MDDAVEHAWLRDRARRAQASRLAANIANAGVDEAKREADEVLRLGQKLFSDNRGPLAAYPHVDIEKDLATSEFPTPNSSTIPKTPSAWSCTCKRRPAAASGCSTSGPSWGRSSTKG